MLRKLLVGAAALTMMAGAAMAQTSGSSSTEGTSALDNPETMKPFYSDEGMTTLRSNDEISAAVKAMNTEDKAKIAQECQNVTTQRESFCKAFNDANKM